MDIPKVDQSQKVYIDLHKAHIELLLSLQRERNLHLKVFQIRKRNKQKLFQIQSTEEGKALKKQLAHVQNSDSSLSARECFMTMQIQFLKRVIQRKNEDIQHEKQAKQYLKQEILEVNKKLENIQVLNVSLMNKYGFSSCSQYVSESLPKNLTKSYKALLGRINAVEKDISCYTFWVNLQKNCDKLNVIQSSNNATRCLAHKSFVDEAQSSLIEGLKEQLDKLSFKYEKVKSESYAYKERFYHVQSRLKHHEVYLQNCQAKLSAFLEGLFDEPIKNRIQEIIKLLNKQERLCLAPVEKLPYHNLECKSEIESNSKFWKLNEVFEGIVTSFSNYFIQENKVLKLSEESQKIKAEKHQVEVEKDMLKQRLTSNQERVMQLHRTILYDIKIKLKENLYKEEYKICKYFLKIIDSQVEIHERLQHELREFVLKFETENYISMDNALKHQQKCQLDFETHVFERLTQLVRKYNPTQVVSICDGGTNTFPEDFSESLNKVQNSVQTPDILRYTQTRKKVSNMTNAKSSERGNANSRQRLLHESPKPERASNLNLEFSEISLESPAKYSSPLLLFENEKENIPELIRSSLNKNRKLACKEIQTVAKHSEVIQSLQAKVENKLAAAHKLEMQKLQELLNDKLTEAVTLKGHLSRNKTYIATLKNKYNELLRQVEILQKERLNMVETISSYKRQISTLKTAKEQVKAYQTDLKGQVEQNKEVLQRLEETNQNIQQRNTRLVSKNTILTNIKKNLEKKISALEETDTSTKLNEKYKVCKKRLRDIAGKFQKMIDVLKILLKNIGSHRLLFYNFKESLNETIRENTVEIDNRMARKTSDIHKDMKQELENKDNHYIQAFVSFFSKIVKENLKEKLREHSPVGNLTFSSSDILNLIDSAKNGNQIENDNEKLIRHLLLEGSEEAVQGLFELLTRETSAKSSKIYVDFLNS